MLGLALWAFAAAYGRMTERLGAVPLLVVAAVALGATLLTAPAFPASFAVQLLVNFVGFFTFFAAGFAFGRWKDRDKYAD